MTLIYTLNTLAVISIAVREIRFPVKALTWVVIGTILPIIGAGIYLALSRHFRFRRDDFNEPRVQREFFELPGDCPPQAVVIAHVVSRMTGIGVCNSFVTPLTNGEKTYPVLIQSLQRAKHNIDMEFFIFRNDNIGRLVTDILIERAQQGVRIRFMVDGLGSHKFSRQVWKTLLKHGVQCRIVFPLRFPWIQPTLNHRDHCKIVVIDGTEAFVGGINIGDEYLIGSPKFGPWRDTHLRVSGHGAQMLARVFEMNWGIATPMGESEQKRTASTHQSMPKKITARALATIGEWGDEMIYSASHPPDLMQAWVQTVESGPDRKMETIRNLFFVCLTQARESVDITTPYFIPDADIMLAMKMAVLRGVSIRLLVPRSPDHWMVGMASRTFYPELLEAGIEIYEHVNGLLHAKVLTVDHYVSVVGAANFDLRSFRLNYEVCEVIYDHDVATQLTSQFEHDVKASCALTRHDIERRSVWQRGVERSARLFAPLL